MGATAVIEAILVIVCDMHTFAAVPLSFRINIVQGFARS